MAHDDLPASRSWQVAAVQNEIICNDGVRQLLTPASYRGGSILGDVRKKALSRIWKGRAAFYSGESRL